MIANLWNYRYLIKRLALSDFKLRYKNSVLGFFWSLLEPLLMLLVLYVVFAHLFPSVEENFHLFLLLGIVSWDFFTKGTSMGLNSIIGKPSLIRQVYIPREVLVLSSCLTALMMAALEFCVFAIFMAFSNVIPTLTIIYFPVIFLILFILIFGISLALGALNTYYRDIQYIWAVLLQAGFFASGVFFKISKFPENIRDILLLNPIARIIIIMRESMLYNMVPSTGDLVFCLVAALAFLLIGYMIFTKLEPGFAEKV
jgi:lipopolysaccharide transport system permease protein